MTIEVERLIATLEANFSKYEKSLNKAIGNTDRGFKRMEDRGRRFEKQMSALGGKLKNFGVGLAAGVGLASIEGLTRALRGAVKEAADLVDLSSKVGIDTDALQQLQFTFSQAGVDAQAVDTILTQWSKRIGEAYTQGGPLAELFKVNNVSLTDGEGRLRSSVDLLGDMADLIKNAASDQERQAIAADAFGKAGAEAVVALKDGAAGLRAGAKEATRLGIILDKDVLARAAQLDDEFDKVATIIDMQIKGGLLSVADAIGSVIEFTREWKEEISALSKLIAAIPIIGPLSVAKDALTDDGKPSGKVGLAVSDKPFDPNAPPADKIDRVFRDRFPRKTIIPGGGEGGVDTNSTASGGSKRESDFARETEQIEERIAAIQAETAAMAGLNPLVEDYGFAIEKARVVQDLLAAAQKEGLAITPELRAKIDALAEGYAFASSAAESLAESQDEIRQRVEEMRDLGKDVMGGFIDDLIQGKSAAEALSNSLAKVGQKLIDIALNDVFSGKGGGGGFLGKLFGGLFGGGTNFAALSATGGYLFHRGGDVGTSGPRRMVHPGVFARAPRLHSGGVAGLRSDEVPAILQRGEVVLPKGVRPSSSGGGVTVSMPISIDATGADAAGLARVEREVAKMRAELPGRVIQAITESRKRNARI